MRIYLVHHMCFSACNSGDYPWSFVQFDLFFTCPKWREYIWCIRCTFQLVTFYLRKPLAWINEMVIVRTRKRFFIYYTSRGATASSVSFLIENVGHQNRGDASGQLSERPLEMLIGHNRNSYLNNDGKSYPMVYSTKHSKLYTGASSLKTGI